LKTDVFEVINRHLHKIWDTLGFNCFAGSNYSQLEPQDGAIVTNARIYNDSSWSEINGYYPYLAIQVPNSSFGVGGERNHDPDQDAPPPTPTPLSATSFNLTGFGGGMSSSGGTSFEIRYTGQATSSQSVPPTLNISINMECNVNGAGFVSGTTATFSVSLDAPA
jgi:hypothetical protein